MSQRKGAMLKGQDQSQKLTREVNVENAEPSMQDDNVQLMERSAASVRK